MSEEERLPFEILNKAIISGKEYGWRQSDVLQVFDAAVAIPMAIIGGQVQYKFQDGICELYWLSYDSSKRQPGEKWPAYCERTKIESTRKFSEIINHTDFEKAAENFDFLIKKLKAGINIEEYKLFIIYFNDDETDLWLHPNK